MHQARGARDLEIVPRVRADATGDATADRREILAETLFEAERSGAAPDERRYLERLATRVRRP